MTGPLGSIARSLVAIGGAFPDGVAGHATPVEATEPGHSMLVDYVSVDVTG